LCVGLQRILLCRIMDHFWEFVQKLISAKLIFTDLWIIHART